ncbi:MAG TPA: hypothetical protein VFE58_10815 [Tepidisphaeraceae bacterium]|jgi:hypothetical protein|nr:hypothetical protein [Tepidisphaeraceae bacterium]
MHSNLPPWARHYVSYIPIVDFQIDPSSGYPFTVLIRRQRITTFFILILSTAFAALLPILLIRDSFSRPHTPPPAGIVSRHSAHSTGIPILLWPLLAGFTGLFLWRTFQQDKAQLAGLGGNERWSFSNTIVRPPMDMTGTELPDLLAGSGHIRAIVNIIGGKYVIDLSAGNRNLYLGPFRSEALASRCEAELRRRLPHWFIEPAGTALLSAVSDGFNTAGYNLPPLPIISFKAITIADGELRLQLQRLQGPRFTIATKAFWTLWLCLWLASIIFLGWMILTALTGGPPHKGPHLDGSTSETLFLLFFVPLWTGLGAIILWHLTLHFRRTETWKFNNSLIITGRNSQFSSLPRLPIDQTVQVRFGPFADPPSVDFISQGKLLHLGPFTTWDLAGEAMGDLERQFPRWHWPSLPKANTD